MRDDKKVLASYFAEKSWSDPPECACPVLTRYCIRLNDSFDKETRRLLKPLIPLLINTRADRETEKKRAQMLVLRMLTVTLPFYMDAIGLSDVSARLRKVTNDGASFRDISSYLIGLQDAVFDAYRSTAVYFCGGPSAYNPYAGPSYAAYAADTLTSYYSSASDHFVDAADRSADACYYASASAEVADDSEFSSPSPAQKEKFKEMREQMIKSALETLRLACEIRPKKAWQGLETIRKHPLVWWLPRREGRKT